MITGYLPSALLAAFACLLVLRSDAQLAIAQLPIRQTPLLRDHWSESHLPAAHVCPTYEAQCKSLVQWNGFRTWRIHQPTVTLMPEPPRAIGTSCFAPALMRSPYSYECLGVFCKAEVKMNKWFPFPVMIRMGDVWQAEALDDKGTFRLAR